jgi:NAD(P)-dependent dehydrogenase (short-subunit alcohol dehydrogenase family)
MKDRICVVTGANAGIGRITALELARAGATVGMVCRDRGRGETARDAIVEETGNDAVHLVVADLSEPDEVARAADEILSTWDRLHVLVNNAGGIFDKRQLSADGLEYTFALNHMGYFRLTHHLRERLLASAPARIVNVASAAHRAGGLDLDDLQWERRRFRGFSAYAASKTANVLFTRELARQLEGTGVTANAVHPGGVNTSFYDHSSGLLKAITPLVRLFLISSEKGARTQIHLATSPDVDGITGRYWAKCRETGTSKQAADMDQARRLWDLSETLGGL